MLDYNEILPKKYIQLADGIYEVLDAHIFRKQKRKPVNQTKLRHLASGNVIERAFHQSETIEEADIQTETAEYIYTRGDTAVFCKAGDPSQRFSLPVERIGSGAQFLVNGTRVTVLLDDSDPDQPAAERVLDVSLPIKVTLTVAEAPPGVRGNTAQGGTKHVTLESGATVSTPLFVEAGEKIVVNTQTGEYVSRA